MSDDKINTFEISNDELIAFTNALADVNCWLAGFVAAGGEYSPGTRQALKTLKLKLDEVAQ